MGQALAGNSSDAEDNFSARRIVLQYELIRQSIAQRIQKSTAYSVLPFYRVEGAEAKADKYKNVSISYTVYGDKSHDIVFLRPDILERFLPIAFQS